MLMTQTTGLAGALPSVQPLFVTDRFDSARSYTEGFSHHALSTMCPAKGSRFVHYQQKQLGGTLFDRVSVEHLDSFKATVSQKRDSYLLQLNLGGECRVQQDDSEFLSHAGSLFVINPDTAASKRWVRECQQLMVWFRRETLYEVLERELKCDLDLPLRFFLPNVDDIEGMSAYTLQVLQAFEFICSQGHALHWRNLRHLEEALVIGLLTTVPNNYSAALDNCDSLVAPYYVRRVEKFLKTHFAEQLQMSDIHEIACVSQRTLFYGFRRFRRTTPMAYLKKIRLEHARDALRRAALEGGNVTTTATNCGFYNVSAFTREYKAMFGETPSETLCRGIS